MKELQIEGGDFIPLCDLLKTTGLCGTGGHAKIVIGDGLVKVDGMIETRKRCKIRPGQVVEYEGQKIQVVAGTSITKT